MRLDVAAGRATVTLSRPERRNPQDPQLWSALADVGRSLPGDVRVVVLRAEGPSFSAGLDRRLLDSGAPEGLAALADLPPEQADEVLRGYQAAFTWWSRPDLVSVVAVQGAAVGAGFQLALACDLRIAAHDAVFCMPETTLGLVPDLGGTSVLVEELGTARALEICLTGRPVSAQEALAGGLVNAVVPPAELDRTVEDLTSALLAAPREAAIETKALLRGARSRTRDQQRAAERDAQVRLIRALAGLGE